MPSTTITSAIGNTSVSAPAKVVVPAVASWRLVAIT
jgi:hypothetical protein